MVSVCLPSDALLQHLPSYLGFSYLGRGVSLHGCSSKAQPLLLTLDEGYLLTAVPPDLERGVAPLGPPAPVQPPPQNLLASFISNGKVGRGRTSLTFLGGHHASNIAPPPDRAGAFSRLFLVKLSPQISSTMCAESMSWGSLTH